MCTNVITKGPAAMREVLAVGGEDVRQTKGRPRILRMALCSFFFLLPLLFREPWPQAGAFAFSGLRDCELCVQLSPGCTGPEGPPTEQ